MQVLCVAGYGWLKEWEAMSPSVPRRMHLALSRQFKVMGKIGGLFAGVWGAIGTFVGMFGGGAFHPSFFLPSFLTFGVMFGAVGGISGICTALLIARGESGRELSEVPTWRVTFWGFLGGFTPGALFALLALTLGATDVLGLLLTVSLASGSVGSAISGSAAAAAKRVEPGDREDQPKLPVA